MNKEWHFYICKGKPMEWTQNIWNMHHTVLYPIHCNHWNEVISLPHLRVHPQGAACVIWNSSCSTHFQHGKRSTGSGGKSPEQQLWTPWGNYGEDGQRACMSMCNAKPDCFQSPKCKPAIPYIYKQLQDTGNNLFFYFSSQLFFSFLFLSYGFSHSQQTN